MVVAVDVSDAVDKINLHTGHAERLAKEGDLQAAAEHLRSLVVALEEVKGVSAKISEHAQRLEEIIDSLLKSIGEGRLTKGGQLVKQLKKSFLREKVELVALLELEVKGERKAA